MVRPKTDDHDWRRRFALRNWRVPTRLTALIVVPTLVAVFLAGIRVVDSIDNLNGYQLSRSAAEYSVHLRDLAEQLALERDLNVWGGISRRRFNIDGQTELTRAQQRAVVDPLVVQVTADLKKIRSDFGERTAEQAERTESRLASLPGIRRNGTAEDYTAIIANLLRLHDELGDETDRPELVGDAQALRAIAHAKEEVALQRSMLTRELLELRQFFTSNDLEQFLAAQSREQGYLTTFYTEAPPAESSRLVTLLGHRDIVDTELTKSWALTLGLKGQSLSRYQGRERIAQRWFQHNTKAIAAMKSVEQRLSTAMVERARQLQSAEQRNVLVTGAMILALLVLVLVSTVLIARSMVRPLRRLRLEALDIAGRRLPEVVRRMRESDDPDREARVQPIPVDTDDEIGEVARAFDEVHTQAVRLAAEESRLRANVNAMFVNLSRRTQTLVERQIALIDGLERGEEDGRRLADLFKLDHLATRMRRNSENLLVLAGHEPPRKRRRPARLVDVVRASLSEVEDYERVTIKVPRNIAIVGHAANDVIHLIAELVENALAYSPRTTRVVVSTTPVDGGAVMLGVADAGIGMSPEEIAEANRRLADPPTVDVSVSRRMGLFVVGRLALRHGIRVQLRRGDEAGIIAMVLFPAQLISDADAPAPPPVGGSAFQPWEAAGRQEFSAASAAWSAPTLADDVAGRRTAQHEETETRGFGPFGLALRDATPPFGTPREAVVGRQEATGAPAPDALGGPNQAGAEPFRGARPGQPGSLEHSGPHPVAGSPLRPGAFRRQAFGDNAAFTGDSGAFSVADSTSATGPVSPVADAPEHGDDYLPIYASVESAWFRRPATAAGRGEQQRDPAASRPGDRPSASSEGAQESASGWWSRADSGFQAAASVQQPLLGGVTAAGLPKRTPRANLVPGSVGTDGAAAGPRPPVSAEAVRNRLSSFQQGVRRGRAEVADGSAAGSGNEEEGS